MRFSGFEPKGRLKQQIRFQTAFLSTSSYSNQTKAAHRHTHIGSTDGKGDGASLSAEEKETVSAITRMLGTTAGAAAGNSAADAVQGGMAADGAVTNNFVHRLDEFGKLYPEQDSPAHDRFNGILEIPFQAADFSSAGINVIFDTDLPVSRSMMGQKAKHGAGSGELIIDAGINAVSVYPPVAAGLASWGVGDSIANNNPEQLGSSLAGLGSSFVLAKTVGNPAYRIDWGGLPTTSSLKLQQMGSINPPRLTKIPANELDVKSYGEAKKGDVKGDNLEHDHIPSFAALVAANETILGRSLTASELRQLKNESTAITLPHELHKQSRTYKGRNTQEQIQEDAQNLCAAQCKDLAVLEKNLEKSGKYTKSEIEQAIKEIKEKNEIRGIKLW